MVTPVSVVRRVRAPVADTPQDIEPANPARESVGGPRTLAPGDGGLAALRRTLSPGASTGVATPATMPAPLHAAADPVASDSHWRARTPLPVLRPQVELPDSEEVSAALNTPGGTPRRAATGEPDRLSLSRAVETLHAFPFVVFDENSLVTQMLPTDATHTPVVSAGLALRWLLEGQVSGDPDERFRRLGHAGVLAGLVSGQAELLDGLRNLGSRLQVGSVIRAADRDLALRLKLLLSPEVAVIDAAAREMSDMLRNSAHTFHLLLLTGGPLPRPVACIRESDALFSVFDPSLGVFAAAGDALQAVIGGIAAEYEQRLLQQRERGELRQALSVLHNAQLMEVAMQGVDMDDDGIRDGGLV